jgi:hypothetical protein
MSRHTCLNLSLLQEQGEGEEEEDLFVFNDTIDGPMEHVTPHLNMCASIFRSCYPASIH